MAVDPLNFEIGEGDLGLQFDLEDEPTDVGGCIGAVLEIKPKDLDVFVGQYIDAMDSFDIAREITFSITMKEDTMRNFVIAVGGDPSDITVSDNVEIYTLPGNSVITSKFAELIYKVARVHDKTKFRKITLYRVKSKGGITYSFNKDKEVQYKVMFKAYADPVHNGSPGQIEKDQLDF